MSGNNNTYNSLIDMFIKDLISRKDYLVEDITEISTTIETHTENDKTDLSKFEINAINGDRKEIATIYNLIHDLDKLKKE